ncbi:hypothetical protein [Sinorhizobium meliloti]|uniref:hypothetical protein n=1 Tax=Rhizobium meliloti TaxID=382 RepID=UPI000B4A0470|nr:hypothetical protein [Sinorhizobium meliloti]ASP55466.1 hypothetical protein CDO31_29450 [Sinorhizobium meliloti]
MKISIRNEYIDVTGRKILIVGENKTSGGLKVFTGFQIDRSKGRIGGERHYKSNGRGYYGDIGSHLIREADSGMSLNDVQAAILERLIEALDTDIAMPGRIGPKMYGSAMTLPISPTVRALIPAGADLEFDRPTCICRLENDRGMDGGVDAVPFERRSVSFLEAADYWSTQ